MDTPTRRVGDTVAKVDGELAVGEDLSFQRKWWRFEKWIWRFFTLIVLADLAGAFGRGPLADASKVTPDGAMTVRYERVERFSTPSILSIQMGSAAVHEGKIRLWVSTSLISRLGNQRIIPEPSSSQIVPDGVIYTFPCAGGSGLVSFALQPANVGISHLTLRLLPADPAAPPQDSLTLGVFVMP